MCVCVFWCAFPVYFRKQNGHTKQQAARLQLIFDGGGCLSKEECGYSGRHVWIGSSDWLQPHLRASGENKRSKICFKRLLAGCLLWHAPNQTCGEKNDKNGNSGALEARNETKKKSLKNQKEKREKKTSSAIKRKSACFQKWPDQGAWMLTYGYWWGGVKNTTFDS